MENYIYNIGQKFYEIAELYSDREAIIYKDEKSYSFRELNKLSNKFARYLTHKNVKIGEVIAIFNDKTIYGFTAMIACLKIGATYVNCDYKSPFERLSKILDRCKPKLILSDLQENFEYFKKIDTPIIQIRNKEVIEEISQFEESNLSISTKIPSSTPAYIMFTSGSTGFPKGAIITHQNLLNFILWGKNEYNIDVEDRFTNVNPIYFDNSVFDFYVSLFNGASLIPFSFKDVTELIKLVQQIDYLKATIWFSVPSMLIYLLTMRVLNKDNFTSLRMIIFGGEGFPKTKLKKLYDLYSSRIKLINVYGPTECTCICSSYNITDKDFCDIEIFASLGKLSKNFSYRLINLDDNNVGELCLISPQVGLGYYNDLTRTEEAFVINDAVIGYKEIMYKTGDLVYENENGLLYFKGRKDNQIKHMGYRIELEEIEFAINAIENVRECAVVYKKNKEVAGKILAFVGASNLTEKGLLISLSEKIPQYMIPKSINIMETLPKNKNGKIDKVYLLENF